MRITGTSLLLSLLLTAGAAAQSTPAPAAPAAVKNPQAQAQLKEITPPDGRFSIMMPGTPVSKTSKSDDGTRQTIEYMNSFEDDNVAYSLNYSSSSSSRMGAMPAANVLQILKQAYLDKLTVDSEKPITLGAVQGLAITAHDAQGIRSDIHLYYADMRWYVLMAGASAGYTATFRDAFFGSFKIK